MLVYRMSQKEGPAQTIDAIQKISLGVLRGVVKPSKIDDKSLSQNFDKNCGSVSVHNGDYFIKLFQDANLSTLVHEMAHVFFLKLERAIQENIADSELQADYKTLCNWVGAEEGKNLTAAQHEQLARGWEAYLMEGKAPVPELDGVFSRFREWLLNIYRTVKNLGVELTDDVRGVFDRMLAFDDRAKSILTTNETFDDWARDCVSGNLPEIGQSALCVDLEDGRVFREYEPCGEVTPKDENTVIVSVFSGQDAIPENEEEKRQMMWKTERDARTSLVEALIERDMQQKKENERKFEQKEEQARKKGRRR